VLSVETARVENATLTPRRMLQMATLDGARDLGLADRTGSITPGKRADLVMVRMNDFNMIQAGDPVDVLVLSGLPQNLDTVIVDGRILKRGGKLLAVDPGQIVAEAHDSIRRMLDLAGWEIPATMRAS
jgi:5-methylthioadenosine/S-adenosylhomocysteine deaminase